MQSQPKSQRVILWILTNGSKVYGKRQKTRRNRHSPEKEDPAGRRTLPGFMTCCETAVIETVRNWARTDHQVSGTEQSPETGPHRCSQLTRDKGTDTPRWRKDILSAPSAGTRAPLSTHTWRRTWTKTARLSHRLTQAHVRPNDGKQNWKAHDESRGKP